MRMMDRGPLVQVVEGRYRVRNVAAWLFVNMTGFIGQRANASIFAVLPADGDHRLMLAPIAGRARSIRATACCRVILKLP
jgi:hypothetical protein